MTESEREQRASAELRQVVDSIFVGEGQGASASASHIDAEIADRLNALVGQLPSEMGAVLRARMAGKTWIEIGTELKVPPDAVRKRFLRAVSRLNGILDDAVPTPPVQKDKDAAKEEVRSPITGGKMGSEEFLAWARETVDEEEIVAGLKEIRETGGLELADFIHELEQETMPRE